MAYNIELNGLEVKNEEGKNLVGSDFSVQIKELDVDRRTFWAIGSEESDDRDKDIIRVEGWNLKNYRNSPRGLWMHNYYEHPHFKTLQIKIDKNTKQLIFQPKFDTHDRAQLTWNQFVNGYLDSFSVGFIPGQFDYRDEDNRWGGGRDFTKNHELLEISAVTIPAHPNARIMRSVGLLPEEDVNLITLGYKPKFEFNEEKGLFWVPIITDLKAYNNPKVINLGKGIKVISAKAKFNKDVDQVIGYNFDTTIGWDERDVRDWCDKNIVVPKTKKFYEINFNKDEEMEIKVVEEVMEGDKVFFDEDDSFEIMEDDKGQKSEDDNDKDLDDDKMCSCEEFQASEEDDNKCKGCGGKKPPKKNEDELEEKDINEDEDETVDSKNYTDESEKLEEIKEYKIDEVKSISLSINLLDFEGKLLKTENFNVSEVGLKNLLHLFDKTYVDNVKSMLDKFGKDVDEIKALLVKLSEMDNKKETEVGLENSGEKEEFIELDFNLVPPVPKEESDSEEFEIEPEELKQLAGKTAADAITKIFEEILIEEKSKINGKLD